MTDRPAGFTVAVVDDDQGILASLELLLESAQYVVRLYASGNALLESGCLQELDCLISDIGMPGMDGFELLRAVRAECPELPIILITGRPGMLERFPLIGPHCYPMFTKPFDGQKLLMAVSNALRKPGERISESDRG